MNGSIQTAGTVAPSQGKRPIGRCRVISPVILFLALLLTAGTEPAGRPVYVLEGKAHPAEAIAAWAAQQQDAAGNPLRLPQARQRMCGST